MSPPLCADYAKIAATATHLGQDMRPAHLKYYKIGGVRVSLFKSWSVVMKIPSRNIFAATIFAGTLLAAPTASADRMTLDPDGVSIWSQIVAWFAGGDVNDAGPSVGSDG
jgi:hypothetical protein